VQRFDFRFCVGNRFIRWSWHVLHHCIDCK
jgi:hypothetical protein